MATFHGVSKEAVTFYKDLLRNNNKEWFEAHKADYKNFIIAPAQQFVLEDVESLYSWLSSRSLSRHTSWER
jgi:uncharacterized protein (DUF2461 family)